MILILKGGGDQLLDPHPHPPALHALPLLHKDLPLPRTLHILERHEGISFRSKFTKLLLLLFLLLLLLLCL